MSDPFDLTGKTALITGSSRGIGLALAWGLAEAGARIVLHAREGGHLDDALEELRAGGHDPQAVAFDVTDRDAVADGVGRIEEQVGPLDILVNNAGIQRRTPFLDIAPEDWDDVLATDLTAPFVVGQAVARRMAPRRRGKIVNIASVQSTLARPGIAAYTTAKGGIAMLTRAMCAELAGNGIQVNALAPGYIATELTRALWEDPEFSAWVTGRTPAGRWGSTVDLTGALVFLCSAASDFVDGQVLYVDGGMTAVV
ncbi:MAG TPA: glucose 1-dehydrogenase [Pseudolysinimonas sp.]|nr:glucose 1-dehydrogenase [Pseudolysinimonas sp.]